MSHLPKPFKVRKLSDNTLYKALEWTGDNHHTILDFMGAENTPVVLEAMPIGAIVIKRDTRSTVPSWLVVTKDTLDAEYSTSIDKYVIDCYKVTQDHTLEFVTSFEHFGIDSYAPSRVLMEHPQYNEEDSYILCWSDGYITTVCSSSSINERFK